MPQYNATSSPIVCWAQIKGLICTRLCLTHGSIGQHNLNVTASLHMALSRLRDRYLERIIWVDALCIDQGNKEERNQQVQIMAMIYAKSARVIVWLGDATVDSDQALEKIREASDDLSTWSSRSPSIQQPILALLQRPWFQRVW